MYLLSFFKKGNTIQGGTLFKGGHYLRKYRISVGALRSSKTRPTFEDENSKLSTSTSLLYFQRNVSSLQEHN